MLKSSGLACRLQGNAITLSTMVVEMKSENASMDERKEASTCIYKLCKRFRINNSSDETQKTNIS